VPSLNLIFQVRVDSGLQQSTKHGVGVAAACYTYTVKARRFPRLPMYLIASVGALRYG